LTFPDCLYNQAQQGDTMTSATIFFILFGVGIIFFFLAVGSMFSNIRKPSFDDDSFAKSFSHIFICWACFGMCELGALISGIVWIVNKFAN
jgi:hypothetical protein